MPSRGELSRTETINHAHEDDLESFQQHVRSKLKALGCKDLAALGSISSFLGVVAANQGPQAVGLVFHHNRFARPSLDYFLLWSEPIDLESPQQGEYLDELEEQHGELAIRLDTHLDSVLEVVDPIRYKSFTSFKDALGRHVSVLPHGQVVGCLRLRSMRKI